VDGGGASGAQPRYSRAERARRRRLLRRGIPAGLALGVVALLLGAILGGGRPADRALAERFASLWARGDYGRMYALLDDPARARTSRAAFVAAYRAAEETATLRAIEVGEVGERRDDALPVRLTLRTRVFGAVRATLDLPIGGSEETPRVAWRPETAFPGLRPGERLTRTTVLPPRAALLAREGTVLAEGEQRASQAPDIAPHLAGRLGPAPPEQRHALRALGYPDDAPVGLSGLERVFQHELAGRPGGTLLAGTRVIARSSPRAARAVRTTIDPTVERAAVAALAGRYGGIAAIVPATGEVLALAGVAFSALQPPGSTFKIVTLTGALEARLARAGTAYPVLSETTIEGVTIENANGEYCGGTLVQSFAHSCNSVFAPLGARLGARRLVDVAERFGFNRPIAIAGAATSTIPDADAIGDPLAVGSSAIGQGLVQATTLQMTSVAATIGMRGRRAQPTLRLGARPRLARVTRPAVARAVARMMRAVVEDGTGSAAAIEGVAVAGKTGTAELASTVPPKDEDEDPPTPALPPEEDEPEPPETDAWFVGYAPAHRPRIAVGALFVEAGAGGDVAAPAVREVLIAALRRRGGF
jgi:peptidoglycan glycosyltransferase